MQDQTLKTSFSIVIAAYNEGEWLKRTVDSVLASDYEKYEIIVVDDASTDNCAAFLNHLEYMAVAFCPLTVNAGVSNARRTGGELATGDYVITVDAHMEFEKEWLTKIDNILQDHRDIKMLGGLVCGMSPEGAKEDFSPYHVYTNINLRLTMPTWMTIKLDKLSVVPFLPGGFMIMEREFYNTIGKQPKWLKHWGHEDIALSLITYYYGYNCYFTPDVKVWHKFGIPRYQLESEFLLYNALAFSYILLDEEYHQLVLERNTNPRSLAMFQESLDELTLVKNEVFSRSKRSFAQFYEEFKEFLVFYKFYSLERGLKVQRDNLEVAISWFEKAKANEVANYKLENAYFNGLAHFYQQETYILHQRYEQALVTGEKAIQDLTYFAPAYYYMGYANFELSNFAMAEEYLLICMNYAEKNKTYDVLDFRSYGVEYKRVLLLSCYHLIKIYWQTNRQKIMELIEKVALYSDFSGDKALLMNSVLEKSSEEWFEVLKNSCFTENYYPIP